MTTLTKNNAKERCRTCLRKLIKNESNADQLEDALGTASSMRTNFILINSDKELQELLDKYVGIEGEEGTSQEKEYPQNVCIECFRQLQNFETFRSKALDSAQKLYSVFRGTSVVHKIELDDNGQECKDAVRLQLRSSGNDNNDTDIFNMLLKDSLMETEAIMLEGTATVHDFSDVGSADPFQAETSEEKRKTKRGKRKDFTVAAPTFNNKTKGAKNSSPNKTQSSRRTRQSKEIVQEENTMTLDSAIIETKPDPEDGIEAAAAKEEKADGSEYEWPPMDFHMEFDDVDESTDSEVLSKKLKHSRKLAKKTKTDSKIDTNDDTDSDSDYALLTLKTGGGKRSSMGDDNDLKDENHDDADEENHFKSERESDEMSSDSEYEAKTSKKKKCVSSLSSRKRSAASGRKKGLTNSFQCKECNRRFGHKVTLDAHVRKIHQGEKRAYKCELCDKSYSFMGGLTTHMRETHERQEDAYECKIPGCDKKYTSYITLQRHVRVKHVMNEVPTRYVCEQCGATFKQTSNLRYHMRTRHPTEEDLKHKEIIKERLECEICNKSFNNLYTLKYHKLRIHADDKKYECKICGRRVAKKFMLDQHMLVHSEDKTACKFCGREFVRKYQVEAHIKAVHQKLKPFQCSHCSESFASRKTLRHHIYIHTGEKPYVCDICGQAYRQPTCLKNHRKIHIKANNSGNNSNNGTESDAANAAGVAAAAAAAAAMAVNRNFLNNLIQGTDDTLPPPSGELSLH